MPRAASFATSFAATLALLAAPAAHAACAICPQWNAPQTPFACSAIRITWVSKACRRAGGDQNAINEHVAATRHLAIKRLR
jgi:hypothetical protein